MAIGAAIFSGVMSLGAAAQQRKAGKLAASAGEAGAQGIEAETEMNIAQTKRAQAQTLGTAKANIAASGVRFDATKIAAVKFTEGGLETTTTENQLAGRFGAGGLGAGGFGDKFGNKVGGFFGPKSKTTEIEGGIQTEGETEGDSVFTYLKEMKRNFATDIAWQSKEGRTRAHVTRLGGQAAKASAYAGALASVSSAVGSFAKAAK